MEKKNNQKADGFFYKHVVFKWNFILFSVGYGKKRGNFSGLLCGCFVSTGNVCNANLQSKKIKLTHSRKNEIRTSRFSTTAIIKLTQNNSIHLGLLHVTRHLLNTRTTELTLLLWPLAPPTFVTAVKPTNYSSCATHHRDV